MVSGRKEIHRGLLRGAKLDHTFHHSKRKKRMKLNKTYAQLIEECLPPRNHPCYSHEKRSIMASSEKAKRIAKILSRFGDLGTSQILDVGCGVGGVTIDLKKNCRKIIGLDPNRKAVSAATMRASEKRSDAIFIVGSASNLPFKEASFDIVVYNHVIEHVFNPERSVSEISRVLKIEGLLYVATQNKFWPIEPHYRLLFLSYLPKSLANDYVKITKRAKDYEDINLLDYRSLTTILERGGFQLNDLSLEIILNPNEYYVSSYVNPSTLKISKKIVGLSIKTLGPLSKKILPWLTASWVVVGQKRYNKLT